MRNSSGKDIVGMGFAVCPVCGCRHDETLVVQTRDTTHPKLDHDNFTGWSMCPEHAALRAEGYIALVEVKNPPQGDTKREQLRAADRTGVICLVRASAWPRIFDVPVPKSGMAFVPPDVIALLQRIPQGN